MKRIGSVSSSVYLTSPLSCRSSYLIVLFVRFLENTLAPAFAKRALTVSAWSQIIVGGSNFGEVRPGCSRFLFADTNCCAATRGSYSLSAFGRGDHTSTLRGTVFEL